MVLVLGLIESSANRRWRKKTASASAAFSKNKSATGGECHLRDWQVDED